MDWIITIPKTVKWSDYEQELDAVVDYSQVMLYRVPHKPKVHPGDRVFVTHNNRVMGWMQVTEEVRHMPDGFTCQTTGAHWRPGYYIARSGPFHYINNVVSYPGFRGIRRFEKGSICR